MLSTLKVTMSPSTTTLDSNPLLVQEEADLYPASMGSHDCNSCGAIMDSTSHADLELFKFLNQVALLLVREYEIVVILPKRSRSDSQVNVMVITDSDSDSDEVRSEQGLAYQANMMKYSSLGTGYLVALNTRNDCPPGKRGNDSAIMELEVHKVFFFFFFSIRLISLRLCGAPIPSP